VIHSNHDPCQTFPFSRSQHLVAEQLNEYMAKKTVCCHCCNLPTDAVTQRRWRCCTVGLSGHVIDWIRSFLTDRIQRVVYDGKCSLLVHLQWGSVLGPLLFVLYTAGLFDLIAAHGVTGHFTPTANCMSARRRSMLNLRSVGRWHV